jgi:hypothetical protein
MVSFSGYGIVSGYTATGDKVSHQLVPSYYDKVGFSYVKPCGTLELQSTTWDFNAFIPEVIVINLGTNDDSYCQDDQDRQNDFSTEYVTFLKMVRRFNPNAVILCTVGIMGERIFRAVDKAVTDYKAVTEDANLFTMKFTEQLPEDGYVTNQHPTERTHEKAAQVLTDRIKEIMKW